MVKLIRLIVTVRNNPFNLIQLKIRDDHESAEGLVFAKSFQPVDCNS